MAIRSENALKRERLDLRASMRPMMDKIGRGERLSAEEMRDMNRINGEVDAIDRQLLDQAEGRELSAGVAAGDAPVTANGAEDRAMVEYLRTGKAPKELREMRAAGEGTSTAGGYLVPPGWWQRLQIALKAFGGIEQDFQPLPTETGQPMAWATNNPTGVVGSLIAENTQITDVDYTFGVGNLSAYMLTSGVQKVSFQLDQDSAFDMGNFIAARVGEALGRIRAQYAISGSGMGQPTGIITALNGAGDVSTTGSGGFLSLGVATKLNVYGPGAGTASFQQVTEVASKALAPQTVAQVIASVDRAYRALGAKWYMNDATLAAMRTVVNGFGEPIYPELLDDTNPKLRGYAVTVDNNVPSIAATTTGGPIFGHLPSAMVMRTVQASPEAPSVGILRLSERYADFLQVGYIGHQRVDMRANDLRAAVTVKAGAS